MDGGSAGGIPTCPNLFNTTSGGPPAVQPLPSPQQTTYQHLELTAFIHFGLDTFDGTEQGNPSDPASIFNPTKLDATTVANWVGTLKAAGFRQAMLTTKHSTGFCLWPSAYTDYSVKNSPWMGGKGDVVKLFTDAMHAAGLRVAFYLSPWDQHYPSSSPSYGMYYMNQLKELLTNYGPVYELEMDGFNSTNTSVDWKSVIQAAKQTQPDIVTWAGPEIGRTGATPDLQWIGNENGNASRTTSSLDLSNCGAGTNRWCAWETNVSDRVPNWFWHPNQSPMSFAKMQSIYFTSVGMNSTLIFNVPPTTTGEFDPQDVMLLQQFGNWYSSLYQTNLVKGQPVTADSTWSNTGFEAAKAVDDDICTYWAASSGKTTARLEVDPPSPITFHVISIREPIELGERSTGYHVEIKQNGKWNTAPSDAAGTQIKGTVIGQRQLWQLNQTTADAIALVIDSARGVPAIAEFGVY